MLVPRTFVRLFVEDGSSRAIPLMAIKKKKKILNFKPNFSLTNL